MTQEKNQDKRNRKALLIPIGVLATAIGVVVVTRMDGVKKILQVGDELFSDDVVETGVGSSATIALADGSELHLGADSLATLDHEVIDPADLAGADLSLLLPPTGAGAEGGEDGGQQTIAKVGRNPLDDTPGDDFPLGDGLGGGGASGEGVVMPRGDYAMGVSGGTDPGGGGEEPPPPPPELPTLTINDVAIKEPASDGGQQQGGNSGESGQHKGWTTTAVFTVELSEPLSESVTVHYKTVDGTATSKGSGAIDYEHTAGVLTIPAGATAATIEVIIYGDDVFEFIDNMNEYFTVELFNPSDNVTITDGIGLGEIIDNEPSGYAGEKVGTEGDDSIELSGSDDGSPAVVGLGGNDNLSGADNDDQIYGGDGDDTLDGKGGDDLLQGGEGNDTLIGGGGEDTLAGMTGNDSLDGGAGDDMLLGGSGDDTLLGGQGADLLVGGGGSDVFVYEQIDVNDADTIRDFQVGQDKLDISQLLSGYENGDDISEFVQLNQVGTTNDYELWVLTGGSSGQGQGSGTAPDFELVATLENLGAGHGSDPITVDDLFTSGSLIMTDNVT